MGKTIIISLITAYQYTLSPDKGVFRPYSKQNTPTCFFYPTCSEFMKQAIQRHGIFRGVFWGVKRVLRCRPAIRNKSQKTKTKDISGA